MVDQLKMAPSMSGYDRFLRHLAFSPPSFDNDARQALKSVYTCPSSACSNRNSEGNYE